MTEERTVDDLVKSYHDTAARLKEIQDKTAEAKAELLTLLQKEVDQEDVPEEVLQKAKSDYDHLSMKAEAFQDRLDSLRGEISAWLPEEARQRVENIQKELEALGQEKKVLNKQYLTLCAQAAVLLEKIKGPSIFDDGRGNYRITTPGLKLDLGRLDSEDTALYIAAVEKARKDTGVETFQESIRGRDSELHKEQKRLQGILADPEAEVQRLIGGLPKTRPEAIEPADENQAAA
ncbi:MAG: hypothetical protein SWQ30_10060 [Thermodesulfobacteriota bacterium]|nr:hypothetical protein [Thermodesulfobacteriota bacterium]